MNTEPLEKQYIDVFEIKDSVRSHERQLNILDKKTAALEQLLQHEHEKLEELKEDFNQCFSKIETRLNELSTIIHDISAEIYKYTGSAATKIKFWVVLSALLTMAISAGLHTILFKHFGINI